MNFMEGKTHKTGSKSKRERFKTGTIIVLVLFAVYFSVLLTQSQVLKGRTASVFIWNNFIGAVRDTDNSSAEERAGNRVFELIDPQLFALTRTDGCRDVFHEGSEQYKQLKSLMRLLTDKLYSGAAAPVTVDVTKDRGKWFNSLQGASVYAKLYCRVDTLLYSQMLGLESSEVCKELSGYSEMSAFAEGGKIVLCFFDDAANQTVFFHTALNASELTGIIESAAQIVAKNYVFAFETDKSEMDSPSEFSLTTEATLKDTILIPSVTVLTPAISAQIPEAVSGPDFRNKIFDLFGYRSSAIRQYTDSNGVQVFVDDYSTLKIHQDGYMEYKANEPKYGVALAGEQSISKANVRYRSLLGVERILLRLMEVSGIESENGGSRLVLNEILGGDSAEDEIRLRLSYCFEGKPVVLFDSNGERLQAVSAVVNQGKLTQLSCCLKIFTAIEEGGHFSSEREMSPNESLFNAINRRGEGVDSVLQIRDAYLYYPATVGSDRLHTMWNVDLNTER